MMPETPVKTPRSALRDTVVVGGPVADSDASTDRTDTKPNAKARPKPSEPATPYRPGHIARGMTEIYVQIGSIVMLFDAPFGNALIENSKKCAESLDRLAKESPGVRRALEAMLSTGAWSAVFIAHAPLFLALPPVRKSLFAGMGDMFKSVDDVVPNFAGKMTDLQDQVMRNVAPA